MAQIEECIPQDSVSDDVILKDEGDILVRVGELLPSHLNFEIVRTISRLRNARSHRVGLQFPEGLLAYSDPISLLLKEFNGVEVVVLGDIVYGACCLDDYTAKALGCDFLVHYGHSSIIPTHVVSKNLRLLYVGVEVNIDVKHLVDTITEHFVFDSGRKAQEISDTDTSFVHEGRIALVSTTQFSRVLKDVANSIDSNVFFVPQVKPLSAGEILGCTAPSLSRNCNDKSLNTRAIIYVGDGRFHLEAIAMAIDGDGEAPDVFKYDPYTKTLLYEVFDYSKFRESREDVLQQAVKIMSRSSDTKPHFGVIMGTLGRQGAVRVVSRVTSAIEKAGWDYIIVLLSEIDPQKLLLINSIDIWVEIACPRLAIDWSDGFVTAGCPPLLTPYELVELASKMENMSRVLDSAVYPMDHFARPPPLWGSYGYR